MLLPKRTKYRKQQKNVRHGMAHRNNRVDFGDFGMKATAKGRMTSRQIEAVRRTITRSLQRQGKVWIKVFPDKPITQKPLEVRQGKGKGNVEYWVVEVRPGMILFEIGGVSEEMARKAFKLASAKLPFSVTFVERTVL